MTALDRLEAALTAHGCDPRRRGEHLESRCPAHEDRKPSLSISVGRDDRVLVKCHTGCQLDEILAALGMARRDLFEAVERPDRPTILHAYNYRDKVGQLVYQTVRYEPKDFRQRRPDGQGGWIWDLRGVERVPYRLPELLAAVAAGETIFVCEGEKDVEAVRRCGAPATCNVGGAKKWRPEYNHYFHGADVVIVADRDDAGRAHARQVAGSLRGVAAQVRIVEATQGKDVSDHLAAGRTLEDLVLAEEPDSEPDSELEPAEMVDLAGDHLNARRFLLQHGDRLLHSPEVGGWFIYNGAWWEEDRLDLVDKLANETIDRLRSWVAEAPNPDEFKRRAKHYADSARSGRRDGMLSIAGPEIAVAVAQLDRHRHLLACRNGTVNLRTGELAPADPRQLLTRGVKLDYDPSAQSPEWQRFLETVFAGDAELISYVQRLLGYAVTGEVGEHLLPNFYGDGNNGKTQLLNAVESVLGDLAAVAPEGLLVESKHEQHPERLAMLRGRRLVVSSELEKRASLAEGLVKALTGGDKISARPMYGRRFDFEPTHTLVVLTNHLARVNGTDLAIWRRIKVVPFAVTIPSAERIPDYGRLLAERHGQAILTWLVRGAVAFYAGGVGTCEAVERATARYREHEDVFGQFLEEKTVQVRGRTPVKDLRAAWRAWAQEVGVAVGRDQDFVDSLTTHGFEVDRGRTSFARGIGLATNQPLNRENAPLSTPRPKLSETRSRGGVYGRGVSRGADVQVEQQKEPDFDSSHEHLSSNAAASLSDDPASPRDRVRTEHEGLALLLGAFPGAEVVGQ
jgi:putative DNA primase/helicase